MEQSNNTCNCIDSKLFGQSLLRGSKCSYWHIMSNRLFPGFHSPSTHCLKINCLARSIQFDAIQTSLLCPSGQVNVVAK